jgi:hypothetical protein
MKNRGRIPSSPYFFRLILIAMAAVFAATALLALIFGAPLQPPAELYNVPNPSKSAWYLLWMQEIVSYNLNFVYLIVLIFLGFLFMPFLIRRPAEEYAKWFDSRFIAANIITVAVFLFIVALTVIAYFFRGEYWQLIWERF